MIAVNFNFRPFQKSKLSASPQSVDEGSTSTCFDEDKDFSNCTTLNRRLFSPQINSTTSMSRDVSLQYLNYSNASFLKSLELRRRADCKHYPPHNHHIKGDPCSKDFLSGIKPPGIFPYLHEDCEGRNDGLGSELLIAAYNVSSLFTLINFNLLCFSWC